MRPRILCPFHKEATPSCILYDTTYYCFGCHKTGPLSDLPNEYYVEAKPIRKTDIETQIKYIAGLSRRTVRGIDLPCDDDFYYIVWPDGDYYIKRHLRHSRADSKYICPTGHTRPLYIPKRGTKGLLVVEGELNALSAAQVLDNWTICSPGGTGAFQKHLTFYKNFDTVVLVADQDSSGLQAIFNTYPALCKIVSVAHYLTTKDFNDVLVQDGKDQLRKKLKEEVGLS